MEKIKLLFTTESGMKVFPDMYSHIIPQIGSTIVRNFEKVKVMSIEYTITTDIMDKIEEVVIIVEEL